MKRKRRKREVISFVPSRVFPSDDELGIDLLRLMAFHDDLGFISDFMRASADRRASSAAATIAASRWFFLQRLFSAVVAELVKVIQNMQKNSRFSALRAALDKDGQKAIQKLLSLPFDKTHPVYRVLYRARNKAGFHFDPSDFAAALRRLQERFGSEGGSTFVKVSDTPRRARMYYMVADQIALEICYGLPAPGQPALEHDALRIAIELHAALSAFLDSAWVAYRKLRKIPAEVFTHRIAE